MLTVGTRVKSTNGRFEGTNPTTGRVKKIKGTGVVTRHESGGYYGLVTVIVWSNGVESFHPEDLPFDVEELS